MSRVWFYQVEGKEHGPFTSSEFKDEAASGGIRPETLIRKEGQSAWSQASKVQGLFPETKTPPPPVSTAPQPQTNTQPQTKACPFCSESIIATAIKCRYCGEFLNKEAHAKSKSHKKPLIPIALQSGLIGLICPGAGQMYNNDVLGGLIWFFVGFSVYVATFSTGFRDAWILGVLTHLFIACLAMISRASKTH